MSIVATIIFLVLLILSVPIAHTLLLSSGIAMALENPLFLFETILNLYKPSSQFPMLAIPFFIFAGNLMMSGRFGDYLINFAKMLVGGMRGGLAQVSVIGSLFFGGVSGSAVADASALGNALIPVQKKQGYPKGYSAAVNASSSTISVLIPPSIPLILYGLVTETSIPKLFIAGILPGILLTIIIFSICYIIAKMKNLPTSPIDDQSSIRLNELFDRFDALLIVVSAPMILLPWFFDLYSGRVTFVVWLATFLVHTLFISKRFRYSNIPESVYKTIPALLMPLFIVLLARGGVVTPTEISVFAVLYVFIISAFVYKDLTTEKILRCILTSGMMTGVIMLVIMGSSVLQWLLSFESVPENLANWMLEVFSSPWMIILSMNLLMILIGTFLDLPAAILLLAPIFFGVAPQIGLDAIQLGVMMVVNLAIGLYTPPVGTTLFVSIAIERVSMGHVVKQLIPFYLGAIAVLAVLSFLPWLTHFSLKLIG